MNVDPKIEPTIAFKFKQKLLFATLIGMVAATILSGSIIGYVRQGSGFGMLVVAFAISLLCVFICCFVFIGRSDIRIDGTSISRLLFGKVIRSIKWYNVKLIRVSPLAKWDSRKRVSAYNILASSVESTSPRTRRIYFGDYDTDVHELIGVINYYINKYQIPVERIVNGKRSSANSI